MLRSFPARGLRAIVAAIGGVVPGVRHRLSPPRFTGANRAVYEALERRQMLSVNVTTYHYSNAETGANTNETILTPSNVNTATFGKVASMAVAGQIYGQPLIMTGVPMAYGEGTHDIVLVTTETDLVYAFDAYGNNPAQGYLWKTSLLQNGETPVPETDYGTTDITPELGITGTPVINPATDTMYLVGLFKESNATYEQRLYALNISSGTNAIAPVLISGSVSGSTYDNSTYNNPGGVVTFSAFRENQRPALTLANGEVYIGWSSHGDQDPWHGWVMAYNATTLHQDFVYCTTADGEEGGIWMSGGGIAVDANGNLYFTTGNGTFDANTNTTSDADYSMSIEELSPSLSVEDYFAPYNQASLSGGDLDYGCSNVILLPPQAGSAPNEVLSAGKWGTIYLNNADALGGYNSNGTGPNDDLGEATLAGANTSTSNVHNTMVYWNGSVYLGGDAFTLQAFSVANGVLGTTPSSQTSHVFGSSSVEDGQGAGLTVSSNGSSNGIVWALDNSGFLQSSAVLYAYNANNLSDLLWSSNEAPNNRDAANIAIKFQDPVVANGYVYTAGDGSLTVYGLLSSSTNTPTLTQAAAANPSTVTAATATLSVLGSDPAGDLSPNYTWAVTNMPGGATTPAFSINDTNNADTSNVTFYAAGSYTFTATIEDPNSGLTTTSSVNVTVTQTLTNAVLSPATVSLNEGATQQFTATVEDQFGNAMATQPTFAWSVNPGGVGGTINSSGLYTAPAAATGTDAITVTGDGFTETASVTVTLPSSTVQVNLTGSDDRVGIVADGTTFGTGIDNDGDALSGNLLGTNPNWNGSSFSIPAPTAGNTTNNVVYGAGQIISLPQDSFAALKLLALHVNGNKTGERLTVTYTDGTTTRFTQSFSDWFTPQNYSGESQAISTTYRDEAGGTADSGPFYVYGYTFALNGAKTVKSITLPSDTNFIVVAMDLINLVVTTPAAASPTTVTGTTTNLSALATDPSADAGPIYTWAATNVPSGAIAPSFSVNGTSTANVSTATFHHAGAYTFTVTMTDPTSGLSATSSVSVTVDQTLTAVNVTPTSPAALYNGQTQQFSAAGVDQFGQGMSSQPSFTWSVNSGPGSVSSTGLYQAPATGTGTATVEASAGGINGQSTIHVILPAWLGTGSVAAWNSSSKILSVTGATSIIADPGSDEPTIQANGSSAVVTINPTSALQVHIGGLSLTNGASAIVTSLGAARTAANHRVLVLGEPGATSAPLLDIDSTSHLDLTDNDLVDHDGNLAAINSLLASGFNSASGYWNGKGIVSSKAAAATLYALGGAQPTAAGTFDGESVTTSDVEVRYTYYGDANLDGHVDASDYSLIDNGYLNHLTGWSNGDFNYDGVINGSDYTLIDNAFNVQGASLDAELAAPSAQIAGPTKGIGSIKTEPVFSNSDLQTAGPGISFAPSQIPLVDLLAASVAPVSYPDESEVITLASLHAQGVTADSSLFYLDTGTSPSQDQATAKTIGMPNYSNVKIMPGEFV